jgi:hypothetical protein
MLYPYHPFHLNKIIKNKKVYFLVIQTTGVQFLLELSGTFLFTDTARKCLLNLLLNTRGLSYVVDMMTTTHFPLLLTKYRYNNIYGLHIILKYLNTCNTKNTFLYKKWNIQIQRLIFCGICW